MLNGVNIAPDNRHSQALVSVLLSLRTVALHRHTDLSVSRPPGRDWKRRPGQSHAYWIDQVLWDSNTSPVELWRCWSDTPALAGYTVMMMMIMMVSVCHVHKIVLEPSERISVGTS